MVRKKQFIIGLLYFLLLSQIISCDFATSETKEGSFQNYSGQYFNQFYGVSAVDVDNVWIVGSPGLILHTKDGGKNWEKQDCKTDVSLFDVCFVNLNCGWIVGEDGVIFNTGNGGKSWERQKSNIEFMLLKTEFIDAQRGWVVGDRGTILFTENGGLTWENISLGEDVIINDIQFLDSNEGWVCGEMGLLLHTKDGGKTWVRQNIGIEISNLFSVFFRDNKEGFLGSAKGLLLKTIDGGESWEKIGSFTDNLTDLTIAGGNLFGVGKTSVMFKYSINNNKSSIKNIRLPESSPFASQWLSKIDFSDEKNGWVVGAHTACLHTQDGGLSWQSYDFLRR